MNTDPIIGSVKIGKNTVYRRVQRPRDKSVRPRPSLLCPATKRSLAVGSVSLQASFCAISAHTNGLTLGAASPAFHRFPAPQPVVQRDFLQMRRAPVDAVRYVVAVGPRRIRQPVLRARVHWIVPGPVEQTTGRVCGRRRPHRSHPMNLPLEPVFAAFGHGRVHAFLVPNKNGHTRIIDDCFPGRNTEPAVNNLRPARKLKRSFTIRTPSA